MRLLLVVFFIVAVLAVPYHANLSLYLNQQKLQSRVHKVLRDHNWVQEVSLVLSKRTCQSDPEVKYLRASKGNPTKNILMVCGIHARQLITVDICIEFLELFVNNSWFTQEVGLDMILVANDQRWSVFAGALCARTDDQGVDLNRNFNVDFEKGNPISSAQSYRGPYPMSQPLSRCVDGLLKRNNYTAVFDLHTGEYSLFHENEAGSVAFNQTRSLLNDIKKRFCKPCRVASIGDTPDPSGHLVTYAQRKYKVRYALLFEVYGGYISNNHVKSNGQKCFKIFNPNFKRFSQYLLDKWVGALNFMFTKIISQ